MSNTNEIKPIQDSYNAVGIAEGFVEETNPKRILLAWSYIGKHKLHHNLQGFFGRNLQAMQQNGLLDANFEPNFDILQEMFDNES